MIRMQTFYSDGNGEQLGFSRNFRTLADAKEYVRNNMCGHRQEFSEIPDVSMPRHEAEIALGYIEAAIRNDEADLGAVRATLRRAIGEIA